MSMTRANRIEQILLRELAPVELMIEDESHNHGAHREVRTARGEVLHDHAHHPSTSSATGAPIVGDIRAARAGRPSPETHFKVLVVSIAFEGLTRVDRQRRVHDLLNSEFKNGLHALTIRALTSEELARGLGDGFVSPGCASRVRR